MGKSMKDGSLTTKVLCLLLGHRLLPTGGYVLGDAWERQFRCVRCGSYAYSEWEGPTEEQFAEWMDA
jgi:hypothetical protein